MRYDWRIMATRTLAGAAGPAATLLMAQLMGAEPIVWRPIIAAALGGALSAWGIDLGAYNRAKAGSEHPDEG